MQSVNGRLGREGVQESRTRERLSTPEESNFLLKKKNTQRAGKHTGLKKKRRKKRHFNYGCAVHTSYVDIIATSVSERLERQRHASQDS